MESIYDEILANEYASGKKLAAFGGLNLQLTIGNVASGAPEVSLALFPGIHSTVTPIKNDVDESVAAILTDGSQTVNTYAVTVAATRDKLLKFQNYLKYSGKKLRLTGIKIAEGSTEQVGRPFCIRKQKLNGQAQTYIIEPRVFKNADSQSEKNVDIDLTTEKYLTAEWDNVLTFDARTEFTRSFVNNTSQMTLFFTEL